MADKENPSQGQPIPQPPEHLYGFLGNLPDIDPSFFARSVWKLADIYGPIYSLNMLSRKIVIVGNYELAKEVLDDDNYEKVVTGPVKQVRDFAGDGLFTAYGDEPNWHKAHRLLMPIFGPMGVRKMLPDMLDISSQMIAKWDRLGPDNIIVASDDFTLAFDTIGLCGYGFRFNEFYSEHVHPFAQQMAENLAEAGKLSARTSLENRLRVFSAKQYQANTEAMTGLCRQLIQDRRKNPQPDRHDLLNVMLNEADPVTGEKLSDQNIVYQMATFLIAGHETTSGTLSFLFYHFLKNPEKLLKAQQEVDEVLGNGPIELAHLSKLKYVDASIKEALRVQGPITAIQRRPKRAQLISGKYHVDKDTPIVVSLALLHLDPAVWGEDTRSFRPERMLDMSKVPAGAWKPFGTGVRSCIGRAFAEQEMIATTALILQRFQIELADLSYDLKLISTLTIKPGDFKFKVRRRPNFSGPIVAFPGAAVSEKPASQPASHSADPGQQATDSVVSVLYGSNAGTCKAFANEIEAAAPSAGFRTQIYTLDEVTEDIAKKPIIVIVPSYEGKPPDNAKKFVSWLESKNDDKDHMKYIRFSVFGVGNSEWVTSYHRVPKLIDELCVSQGAQRICDSVFADIKENAVGDFEEWLAGFWKALRSQQGSKPTVGQTQSLKAQVIKSGTPSILAGNEMSLGIVKQNREIADASVGPAKRHVEVELPEGTTYQTGDYISLLPHNPQSVIARVLNRFELHPADLLNVQDTKKTYLLTDTPMSAFEFFATRVDLSTMATQRQLATLATVTADPEEKAHLEFLKASSNEYKSSILEKRMSVLDVLEDHPACKLDLSEYIATLKPLAPRQYSISSSPHSSTDNTSGHTKTTATISFDVYSAPALSGKDRHFHGVASTYLATRSVGSRIYCNVRSTNIGFHLPPDPKTPIIMIAAGTGLAPMRGFIQERAAIASARGADALGPALFYFGCRDFEKDYIYKSELEAWEKQGVVAMRPTFSKRAPPDHEGYKYVPDRLWAEREEVSELYRNGAKVFLCGSAGKLAKSTTDILVKIVKDRMPEKSQEDCEAFVEKMKEDRYVTDVFG